MRNFLQDPGSIRELQNTGRSWPSSDTGSKSSFEKLTAAINVTPTTNGRYDVKQLKEDALWLAKETGIDEVSALRIAILEWQMRPATRLLQRNPAETNSNPRVASLRSSLFSTSSVGLKSSVNQESSDFNSALQRYTRLLDCYLVERQFLVKVVNYLTFLNLARFVSKVPDWLSGIGTEILESWNCRESDSGISKSYAVNSLRSIDEYLARIDSGCGWIRDEGCPEWLEVLHKNTMAMEIISQMQTLLFLASSTQLVQRFDVVLSWFDFVTKYRFFDRLPLVS